MPIYVKTGSYTLGETFSAGGGNYTQASVDSLKLWTRFRASPVDESGNGLTVAYTGSPAITDEEIPNREISKISALPVAAFDGTSDNAAISATSLLAFKDGSDDLPFTVSGWISIPESGTTQFLFSMPEPSNTYAAYTLALDSQSSLVFILNTNGGVIPPDRIYTQTINNVVPRGEWAHFAVSYDGSKSHTGVSFYVNGNKHETDGTTVDYTGLNVNSSRPLKIGAKFDGSAKMKGSMSEFAIWGSELKSGDVKALYHSTAGRYRVHTGIVSTPNRVRIRHEDNQLGSYPNQLRTTGRKHDKGNDLVVYDDTRMQIFNPSNNISYPMNNSDINLDHLDLTRLIASPNHTSNIIASGSARPYVSDQGTYIPRAKNAIKPFNESKIFLKDKTDIFYATGTNPLDYPGFQSPLRDKIIINVPINNGVEKTVTRYSGQNIASDPGGLFQNTFKSTGFYYYNFNILTWEDIGLTDSYTMYYSGSETSSQVSNVSLGTNIKDQLMGSKNQANSTKEGNLPKMQQFKMSDHSGVFIDSVSDKRETAGYEKFPNRDPYSDLSGTLGYHLIGACTQTGLAPMHPRYHASSSQVFSISDYITGDFLLEKAVVEVPVVVQRMRGTVAGNGSSGNRFHDTCRDIDNYNFFLYRQRRPESSSRKDTKHVVSASKREIVCSGSAAFFNSNAFSGRVPGEIRKRGLPHTPSFSHDFNISSTYDSSLSNSAQPLITAFTGTIRIEMTVANPTGQPVGVSRFPLAGPLISTLAGSTLTAIGNLPNRSVAVQDFWARNREAVSGTLRNQSSYNIIHSNPIIFNPLDGFVAGLGPFSPKQAHLPGRQGSKLGKSFLNKANRELKDSIGVGSYSSVNYQTMTLNNGRITTSGTLDRSMGIIGYTGNSEKSGPNMPALFGSYPSSTVSGFIFEPGDELVLGIDAGISMLPASGANMTTYDSWGPTDAGVDLGFYSGSNPPKFSCMSGSFMKILAGEASLTLFGSQIRKGREVLGTSNEHLTSNAIHESVGDARLIDQHDIPSRYDLSGSYVDRLNYGTLFTTQEQLNQTNSITISQLGLNAANSYNHGVYLWKTARSTISLFSKNRGGVHDAINSTDYPSWTSIDHDQSSGYSPRTFGDDSPEYLFYVENTVPVSKADPYSVTPLKSSLLAQSNIVSLQRFITIPSKELTYYDSMAPDIIDFAERASAQIPEPTVRVVTNSGLRGVPIVKIWPGNMHKLSEYPYETNPTRHKQQKFVAQIVPNHGPNSSTTSTANTYTTVTSSYGSKLINCTLFNLGFRYSQNIPGDFRGFYYPVLSGAHGPRYGMISPVLAKPTARFRRDRFGQFRDLLEQSYDTKFHIEPVAGVAYNGDSPVQIKFVDRANGKTPVSPFSTDSQNCSLEATSSIPYTDGVASYTPSPRSSTLITLDGTDLVGLFETL